MNHRDTKRLINALILRRYNDAMRIKRLKRRLNDLNLFVVSGRAGGKLQKIIQLLKNKGLIGAAGVGAGAFAIKKSNKNKVASELARHNLSKDEIDYVLDNFDDE